METEINNIKIKMAEITTEIKGISEKLTCHIIDQKENDKLVSKKFDETQFKIEERFDKLQNTLENSIKSNEKKFAAKWVEQVLWGAGTLVGTAIVIEFIRVVLNINFRV